MKIKEITGALERFAPLPLQDGYDNAGLQVGLTEAEATGALLCIDVTEAVVDEAIACGCNLIVAHHPLLFKGCKSITGKNYVERCIYKAIRHDIAIYAAHTNLDNAQGGVSHKMAEKLGLTNVRILDEKKDMLLKMATYVPEEKADEVRQALWQAGCGCIGNYDCCSYNLEGTGTFRAQPGTHPYCGSIGQVHSQREVRVETVLPRYRQPQALAAIARTHPYEEPAIDVHALQNTWAQAGLWHRRRAGQADAPRRLPPKGEGDVCRRLPAPQRPCLEGGETGSLVRRCGSLPPAAGHAAGGRCLHHRRDKVSRLLRVRQHAVGPKRDTTKANSTPRKSSPKSSAKPARNLQ